MTSDVPHTPRQVVTVMVRANIAFFLACKDRFTRAFVGAHAQRCVVLTCRGLDVLGSACLGLQEAAGGHWRLGTLGQWQHGTLTVCNVRIDLQIGPVLRVGSLPLVLVALKLTTVADERCLGCQRQHFGFLTNPIVVHTLGIFGISYQARHVQAAIHLKFVADNPNHGNPLACPLAFLKNLVPVDLAVLDPGAI